MRPHGLQAVSERLGTLPPGTSGATRRHGTLGGLCLTPTLHDARQPELGAGMPSSTSAWTHRRVHAQRPVGYNAHFVETLPRENQDDRSGD